MEGDLIFCFDLARGKVAANYPVMSLSVSSRDSDEVEEVATNFVNFLERRLEAE